MVVKLTQEQADYLETFEGNKKTAIYFIACWGLGCGLYLKDGNGKIYEDGEEKPFEQDETEKMLNALINGYEVDVPEYKFHNFSNITNVKRLYYAGKDVELTSVDSFAKVVKKNSDEYLSLKNLGFLEEKV